MSKQPVVIVTGASRGLGKAVSLWLAAAGVRLVLTARSHDELEKTQQAAAAAGAQTLIQSGDIVDPQHCRRTAEAALATFNRIDGLVNNAGTFEPLATVAAAPVDAWKHSLAVNLLGPFYLTRYCLPALRRSAGRIVNVSSGAATHVIAGASAYCAAKAALNQFTRVLAAEEQDITAVAVRPGVVDTRMQEFIRRKGPRVMPREQADFYLDLKASGQLEPPQVPGRSVAWLVLKAPHDWSGAFMNYDDARIAASSLAMFGDATQPAPDNS